MSKNSIQFEETKYSAKEVQQIRAAELMAAMAHKGQKRKSGEPYAIHPLAVAQSLADWGMDAVTIQAGLLHDTVEDTHITLDEIRKEFGDKVAELVDGVTKLGELDQMPQTAWSGSRGAISLENLRKLLLAISKDLRVIMIKLADTRHNLQTLKYLPPDNQKRFAQESLEIYAPLADRLGMGELKAEIEDLSFRYADPTAYHQVEDLMKRYTKQTNRYLAKLKRFIADELKKSGVKPVSIEGRQKHYYSVYKKLKKADGEFDKIYDLIAVRVIVEEVSDCYKAMGILHQHFKPLIYRIKDYIAVPKPNGYRSLHTTVFAIDGRITEIQIRTPEMHQEAERGVAAHFFYDTEKATKNYLRRQTKRLPSKYTWVSSLADLHGVTASGQEFVEALKVDLFHDRIFAFSPKGDLYDLPEGSTPVDFAFAVHSDIGLRAQGAKINGRLSPLDTKLENRDVVEIQTRKQPSPNRDWLNSVKTPHARNRVRAWFRATSRDDNITSGRQSIEQELKIWGHKHLEDVGEAKLHELVDQMHYKDTDTILAAVGEGTLTAAQVMRRLFPPSSKPALHHAVIKRAIATGRIVLADAPGLDYHLAPCCKPAFPQPIAGYITRGSGITIHLKTCHNLPAEPDRLTEAHWEVEGKQDKLLVPLEIVALNRVGLLRDLTAAISGLGINISGISSRDRKGGEETEVRINVEVADIFVLAKVIKKVEQLPMVVDVKKLAEQTEQKM